MKLSKKFKQVSLFIILTGILTSALTAGFYFAMPKDDSVEMKPLVVTFQPGDGEPLSIYSTVSGGLLSSSSSGDGQDYSTWYEGQPNNGFRIVGTKTKDNQEMSGPPILYLEVLSVSRISPSEIHVRLTNYVETELCWEGKGAAYVDTGQQVFLLPHTLQPRRDTIDLAIKLEASGKPSRLESDNREDEK